MMKRWGTIALVLGTGAITSLANVSPGWAGNGTHSETRSSRLAAFNRPPTCRAMRRHIRRELRDNARRHCVRSHGSSGVNKVRREIFFELRCVRNGPTNSFVRMRMDWRCK